MRTRCISFLTMLFLSGVFNLLIGSEPPGKIVETTLVSLANQSKIKKCNALIEKGNQFWVEADSYTSELKMLQSEFRFSNAKKVEKKQERLRVQAANYYRDGHKGQFKILQKEIESALKTKDSDAGREALMDGGSLFKKAKVARMSAQNSATDEKTSALYFEAIALENQAISLMEGFFKPESASGNLAAAVEEPVVSIQEERVEPVISAPVVIAPPTPPVAVAAPVAAAVVSVPAVVPVEQPVVKPVEKAPSSVFFAIQILADKQAAPASAVSKIYSGPLKVSSVEADGWHRYMVGRFSSVAEARKAMTDEGIKGFIVAYNGLKRIPVQEAVDLLSQNK